MEPEAVVTRTSSMRGRRLQISREKDFPLRSSARKQPPDTLKLKDQRDHISRMTKRPRNAFAERAPPPASEAGMTSCPLNHRAEMTSAFARLLKHRFLKAAAYEETNTIINRTLKILTCLLIRILLFWNVFKSGPLDVESPDL